MLSGQLRGYLVAPGIPGPKSLTFQRAEAEDILDDLGAPGRAGKIVLGNVKRRLGISAQSVHQLVAEGFLLKPERTCGFIFDLAAIEAFEGEFANDALLARKQRTRPVVVRRAIKLLGILPVTTLKSKTGTVASLYRKEELGPMTT